MIYKYTVYNHGLKTVFKVESALTGVHCKSARATGLRRLSSVTNCGQTGSHRISTLDTAHGGLLRFHSVIYGDAPE